MYQAINVRGDKDMFLDYAMQDRAIRIIQEGGKPLTNERFIEHEIRRVKQSKEWNWMLTGDDYYRGRHDILKKTRTAIGDDGNLIEVKNLPNAKLVDNVYKRMVKQKTNYLLGKPFTVDSDDDLYTEALTWFFDKAFMRKLKSVGKDCLNCGIGWLYCYYDEQGEFQFKRFRPFEIIPEWKDIDHTQLDSVIRFYEVDYFDGREDSKITKVEHYTAQGIDYYQMDRTDGHIVAVEPFHQPYMMFDGVGYNWDKLPFIAFKYNDEEQPLIVNCKSLQDGLNTILSNFDDQMNEDSRNTILVLVNYDGENLGEFRRNLATYGAVKIRSAEGASGDVRTLQVEVNSENYKAISDIFKRAIIENCMGYDAKDERLGGSPNQMNIQSMYNDIDLDASDMETEFQAAFDDVLYFVDLHLQNAGQGDYTTVEARITFNTSMPMDESSVIQNAQNSTGIISKRTITAHHPWVTDLDAELEQLAEEEAEEQKKLEAQYNPFGVGGTDPGDNEPPEGDGDAE